MLPRLSKHTRRRHQPVLGLLLLLASIVLMVVGRLPGAAGFLLASCSSSSSSRASGLLLGASHRARVGSAITTTVQWHISRYVQTHKKERGKESSASGLGRHCEISSRADFAGLDSRDSLRSNPFKRSTECVSGRHTAGTHTSIPFF